jgi:hypothetical protein
MVYQLESNVTKLGNLDAPPSADPRIAASIRSAISEAFVFGFRLVMLVCACLALASAVVAWDKLPSQIVIP